MREERGVIPPELPVSEMVPVPTARENNCPALAPFKAPLIVMLELVVESVEVVLTKTLLA